MARRVLFSVVIFAVVATVYAADPAKARKRLENDGNEFTVDKFLTNVFLDETKTVQLYLEAGMPPDAADEKGTSAMHRAAANDTDRTLAVLIKAGAKIDPRDKDQNTPLCRAAASGKPKNVALLIKSGADVNAVCSFAKTPLHEAAFESDAASVDQLLAAHANVDARDSHNETALIIASHRGSLPIVTALLKAGADVHAKGNSGDTPLHEAVGSDNAAITKVLLDAGADPNAKNRGGRAPLYEAARFGRPSVIPLLLAAGADPNMKSDGTTPIAAAREEGKKDIITMLENAKPVTPAAHKEAAAASSTAAPRPTSGDALAQLKQMGIKTVDSDTLFTRIEARDVRAVTLLVAAGAKTNARNDVGRTPLYEAIGNDDVATVKALIAAGADVNDPGKAARKEFESGETLVMEAVDRQDPDELLAALIAGGADVNKGNMYGVNPIMSAAMQGKAGAVKLLIAGKANVNAVDSAGTPVIFSAVKGGNADVFRLLIAGGAKIGQHRKLLLDTAESDKNAEMKALITAAAGKEPAGTKVVAVKPKAPPPLDMSQFPKPVTLGIGKKPVLARQVYDALLPIVRKWQDDAELVDLGTVATGLDAAGKSANWNAKFYSRSAQKMNLMSVTDGVLTATPVQSNEMRIVPVTESTILDTAKLNQIAEAAGASAYTSRGMHPEATLIHNPSAGDAWYFNYSDPATQKNVLTIIIDANSGKVVYKDAK
ncbi:MAG TPA: ankyrin repeat domain-containing protein [Thermoanaerobaculia bacterium]|nr:ankyrin repeat domain-containing protein [Thermoanaerobaculia bacterium]